MNTLFGKEMRFKKEVQSLNGWKISFKNNVHMYCHHLEATKSGNKLDVPCEDTPDGYIGIWFMNTNFNDKILEELIAVLAVFFQDLGSPFKIFNRDGEIVAELALAP